MSRMHSSPDPTFVLSPERYPSGFRWPAFPKYEHIVGRALAPFQTMFVYADNQLVGYTQNRDHITAGLRFDDPPMALGMFLQSHIHEGERPHYDTWRTVLRNEPPADRKTPDIGTFRLDKLHGTYRCVGFYHAYVTERIRVVGLTYFPDKPDQPLEPVPLAKPELLLSWMDEMDRELMMSTYLVGVPENVWTSFEAWRACVLYMGHTNHPMKRVYLKPSVSFDEDEGVSLPNAFRIHVETDAMGVVNQLLDQSVSALTDPAIRVHVGLYPGGAVFMGAVSMSYARCREIGLAKLVRRLKMLDGTVLSKRYMGSVQTATRWWLPEAGAFDLRGTHDVLTTFFSRVDREQIVVPVWNYTSVKTQLLLVKRTDDPLFVDTTKDLGVLLLRNGNATTAPTVVSRLNKLNIMAGDPEPISVFLDEE